jgi:phage terminase small subunit
MPAPRRTPDTPLRLKHQQLLTAFLETGSVKKAAAATGYSPVRASQILNQPHVKLEKKKIYQEIVQHTKYDVEAAMKDMRDAAAFARETENATALVRAHEMMMKLHGLLIERVDQRQVGNFSVAIRGIEDDDPPIEHESTFEKVFDDGG